MRCRAALDIGVQRVNEICLQKQHKLQNSYKIFKTEIELETLLPRIPIVHEPIVTYERTKQKTRNRDKDGRDKGRVRVSIGRGLPVTAQPLSLSLSVSFSCDKLTARLDYCRNAFACDKASRRTRQHPYTVYSLTDRRDLWPSKHG